MSYRAFCSAYIHVVTALLTQSFVSAQTTESRSLSISTDPSKYHGKPKNTTGYRKIPQDTEVLCGNPSVLCGSPSVLCGFCSLGSPKGFLGIPSVLVLPQYTVVKPWYSFGNVSVTTVECLEFLVGSKFAF